MHTVELGEATLHRQHTHLTTASTLLPQFELFKTAGQAHLVFLQRCMRGHGIDRHLLGMRILSYQTGLTPKLFADPVYVKSSHWTLSTSQMAYVHGCSGAPHTQRKLALLTLHAEQTGSRPSTGPALVRPRKMPTAAATCVV